MAQWLEEAGGGGGVGDPGRVHEEGHRARGVVESARETVAGFLGTEPSRVIFTSGATEAANTAVFSSAALRPGAPLACAGVEHSCVREACRRAGHVLEIAVDASGRLLVEALAELMAAERPALVNCQFANHEVGTLQPVAEVAGLCRQAQPQGPTAAFRQIFQQWAPRDPSQPLAERREPEAVAATTQPRPGGRRWEDDNA